MGAMDAGNMWIKLAVNKYLHTVASCLILLIQSHDARNREYSTRTTLEVFKPETFDFAKIQKRVFKRYLSLVILERTLPACCGTV